MAEGKRVIFNLYSMLPVSATILSPADGTNYDYRIATEDGRRFLAFKHELEVI